jgi:2-phospho-L-lactate guanylyltransferase
MWAIVPIKRFAEAKQRLAPLLSPAQRAELARHMAEGVLTELRRLPWLDGVLVVSAESGLSNLVRRLCFEPFDDAGAGLNAALDAAGARLAGRGIGETVIVHADLPLFHAGALEHAAALHRRGGARRMTIVTDLRGGGTNVRFCRPAAAVSAHYGEGSAARHRAAAQAAGLAVETVTLRELSFDCDTPDDLRMAYGNRLPSGAAFGAHRATSAA